MTYAELLTHAHHVVMPADYGGPSELPALKVGCWGAQDALFKRWLGKGWDRRQVR